MKTHYTSDTDLNREFTVTRHHHQYTEQPVTYYGLADYRRAITQAAETHPDFDITPTSTLNELVAFDAHDLRRIVFEQAEDDIA